jgi:hypothetical protein
MKSIEHGYKSAMSVTTSSRIEAEKEAPPAPMAETGAAPYCLGESIGTDDALGEAARTLRNEVEAIASLADRDEAASRTLGEDYSVLPRRDEPLEAEVALLISGIEEELAVMCVLADTLAARLRGISTESFEEEMS